MCVALFDVSSQCIHACLFIHTPADIHCTYIHAYATHRSNGSGRQYRSSPIASSDLIEVGERIKHIAIVPLVWILVHGTVSSMYCRIYVCVIVVMIIVLLYLNFMILCDSALYVLTYLFFCCSIHLRLISDT